MKKLEILNRVNFYNFPSLKYEDIENLCNKLNVNFSSEFIELSKIADFQYFSYFDISNLRLEGDYSVIGDTLRLRKSIGLPNNILYLSEDDTSVLLMKCFGDHEEIYWITIEDLENFCKGIPFQYDSTIYPTFMDFFEYLLEQEELERNNST